MNISKPKMLNHEYMKKVNKKKQPITQLTEPNIR